MIGLSKTAIYLAILAPALAQAAAVVDVASTRSYGTAAPSVGASSLEAARPANQLEAVNSVLLIETTSTFLGQCLSDLGIAYDSFSGNDFSGVDLSGYQQVFLGMDGGLVEDASIANIANFASNGGAVHIVGGSCYAPYAAAVNAHLLENDTANYCWSTVAGSPDSTVTDAGHYLATGLPATYNFVNNSASYYSLRPTDAGASVAAVNGDSYDHLLSKPIGSGSFDILTNSPYASYWLDAGDYAWGCNAVANMTSVQADFGSRAAFRVTKTFSDGSTDEVNVHLTCNSGVPLEQDFTIAGGDPAGVTFVVQDIPDGGANCEVTESGGPAGYTPVLNGGNGCSWDGIAGGFFNCQITNEANPATFTVNKEWYIENSGGEEVNQQALVTVYCNNEIVGGSWNGYSYVYSAWLDGDDSVDVTVDTTQQSAQCYAVEEVNQTGVESADDCGSRSIAAGSSSSCTFTNTVFFEGIPTLSQWGLAILAVLTLGVGLIGFRRFA